MIRDRAEELDRPTPIPLSGIVLMALVIFAHGLVILGNLISSVVLVIWTCLGLPAPAWAVVCPIVTFVIWATTSRNYDCPLTRAEDTIRERHKRPPIKAFLKHYVVDPLREWRRG
jgi:hypothetical protein